MSEPKKHNFKDLHRLRRTRRRWEIQQQFRGYSVPLGAMERAANTRTITIPIANHDNNQRSSNENIRLQNLWDGIETMAALMQTE